MMVGGSNPSAPTIIFKSSWHVSIRYLF
jgi:hypothetical protein